MDTSTAFNRNFLNLCLGSAAVVTLVRVFHAADLGGDLPYQIEAAQNLLAGVGFVHHGEPTNNLAEPVRLVSLTHFAAGYSWLAAALITLGATPDIVLKLLAALPTILGWWGWARLASAYMEEGWQRDKWWRWIAYFIAIVCPLFYTMPWSGTDIFLWAVIPWVLLLVTRSMQSADQNAIRWDAIAGVLTGFAVLMRYASLFLAAYAFFLIACQCGRQVGSLAKRVLAFGAGMAPLLAMQLYVNYFLAIGPSLPGGLNFSGGVSAGAHRAWDSLGHLTAATTLVLFWVPGRILDRLSSPAFRWVVGALAVLVVLSPVLFAIARKLWSVSVAFHDVRLAGLGLFCVFPALLLACEIFGKYDYARDPRYYWPAVPLAVLAAYSLAAPGPSAHSRGFKVFFRLVGGLYLGTFLLASALNLAVVGLPGGSGYWRRTMVVGTRDLRGWPSGGLTFDVSPARRQVVDMMKAQPETILLTNPGLLQWFILDDEVDRTRLQIIQPCEVLKSTFATGPAHFLVLTVDRGGSLQDLPWYQGADREGRAECVERLPPRTLVRRFPDEQRMTLKLLKVDIPGGQRVELKPVATP